MDQGIKAIWYDLPNDGRDAYFDWLHCKYLPQLLNLPGRLWAVHYEITGGGKEMDIICNVLARSEEGEVGTGTTGDCHRERSGNRRDGGMVFTIPFSCNAPYDRMHSSP